MSNDVVSLMFSLNSEQCDLLEFYSFNPEGNLLIETLDMSARIIARRAGILDIRYRSISFVKDPLTKNIVINLHVENGEEVTKFLKSDDLHYTVKLIKLCRSSKLRINVVWDGYDAK